MYNYIFLILIYFEIGETKILSDKLNVLLILGKHFIWISLYLYIIMCSKKTQNTVD